MPNLSYDVVRRIVELESGVLAYTAIELYSQWKDDKITLSALKGHPPVFLPEGGLPLGNFQTPPFVILNNLAGWKIKPPEEDIGTILITGNIVPNDSSATAINFLTDTDGDFFANIQLLSANVAIEQQLKEDVTLMKKLQTNKRILNRTTGILTIYDDDGTTSLLTISTFEDEAGATPYDGTDAIHRQEKGV